MVTSTRQIMGMPVTLKLVSGTPEILGQVFNYFREVDARYSTYKINSEISRINSGLPKSQWSREMRQVLKLCEQTKLQANGYFNIKHNGLLDPSGLVKGWAINNAADLLLKHGYDDLYIEAGGDIQTHGHNQHGEPWHIGIRSPFNRHQIIKTVHVTDEGVATSGTYIRGQHVYNPINPNKPPTGIVSLTVIGPNIYEADRFATAAFAMGRQGIRFIDSLDGFEGYQIDANGVATLTRNFDRYVA